MSKYCLKDMQDISLSRGGACLSEYNCHKMFFRCIKGHEWFARPSCIRRGSWCPICANENRKQRKYSIQFAKEIAATHDGKCLSEKYNYNEGMLWECKNGHVWKARLYSVISGHWCAKCAHIISGKKRQTYSIAKLEMLANRRDGKCLSEKYLGYDAQHLWECKDGHQWYTNLDNIVKGSWCPKCSKIKHFAEEKCRYIIEQLTGLEFPSNRKILDNGQELDLYNEQYKIAIEYHGIQHYEFVKAWHKNDDGFNYGQERDRRKSELCEKLGIKLFIVNYKHSKADKYLVDFLRDIITQSGLPIIRKRISFKNFYDKLSSLKHLYKLAKDRGGKCLSREYINSSTKCEFQCNKGHIFKMEPKHVRSGHWCRQCGYAQCGDKNRRLSLKDAQQSAEKHNGKCLSIEYKGTQHELKWECSEGHIWESPYEEIRSGSWCSICGHKKAGEKMKSTLQSVQIIAEQKNGKCISVEYINNRTKLEFECSNKHRWLATPCHIKQGYWCIKCAHKK